GWFAGFAPADNPKVAVVVFLERGTGPGDAAPLAAQILQAWMAEPK
ncbi:MAG: penicillin-binding transpeptidase domain-containing protein, partial [Burkholderiales bacterium]